MEPGATQYIGHIKPRWGGGMGGTPIFSPYVGLGPASTVYPQKYQEYQAPKKYFFATQNNIPILYNPLRKDPKIHKNKTSPSLR